MNGETKNDLSAGEVKLDYQALLTTSIVAMAHLGRAIDKCRSEIDDAYSEKEYSRMYLRAEYLINYAKNYAIVVDTYCALKEGIDRENKILVNLPEVK